MLETKRAGWERDCNLDHLEPFLLVVAKMRVTGREGAVVARLHKKRHAIRFTSVGPRDEELHRRLKCV
jgi:hypothetical protein